MGSSLPRDLNKFGSAAVKLNLLSVFILMPYKQFALSPSIEKTMWGALQKFIINRS